MQIQTKPRTPSLMALPGIPMHFKKSDRQDLGGCFCLHEIYTKIYVFCVIYLLTSHRWTISSIYTKSCKPQRDILQLFTQFFIRLSLSFYHISLHNQP